MDTEEEEETYGVWHSESGMPLSHQGARSHRQHMAELMDRIARLRASQAVMEREVYRLKREWMVVYASLHHLKRDQWPVILKQLEAAADATEG